MNKILLLILCGVRECLTRETLKNNFKKLLNKKVASTGSYHHNANLFQCYNKCKKTDGCQIFNYNNPLQICQLTDKASGQEIQETNNNGWGSYIPVRKEGKLAAKTLEKTVEVMNITNTLVQLVKLNLEIDTAELTICFWVKANSPANSKYIFSMNDAGNCGYMRLFIKNEYLRFWISVTDTTLQSEPKIPILDTNKFHHVCFAFNNGNLSWYHNGQKVEEVINPQLNLAKIRGTEILLGTRTTDCMTSGGYALNQAVLFDFVVFTSSLTRLEIQQVMSGQNSIPTALSWAQVIGKYVNVSTTDIKFQELPISQVKLQNTN